MMCGVRLGDRMSTDVLCDWVGVVVKIEDMIIQSHLWWYGHVMHGDIDSQIREVMEIKITGKRKKGQPRKSWEECVKDLKQYGLRREDVLHTIERNAKNVLEQELLTLASQDSITTDVAVAVVGGLFAPSRLPPPASPPTITTSPKVPS